MESTVSTIRDTVEFLKRHRNKIATGATIVGGIYVVKKVVESEKFVEVKHSASNVLYGNSELSDSRDQYFQSNLSQARKNFIFDSHQQSCDKTVLSIIHDFRDQLGKRFETASLVERLKQGKIEPKVKIALWEDLKIRTFGRIMAAAYCSSLILIACKLQKSILCQETCKNMEKNESKQTSSWTAGIANYVSSYFWDKPEETIQSGPDAQTQQLFSNCINFLATDGIKALCDKIEAVSTEVFDNVSLSKEVNVKHLLEKIKSKMENVTGCKNFSEYVIPLSRPAITSLLNHSTNLQRLLTQFVTALESYSCRTILSNFVQLYIEEFTDILNETTFEKANLPLAKVIPIANDAFWKICSSKNDGTFHRLINSSELYQLCLLVFNTPSDLEHLLPESS
ncbi:peroxin-3 domain-containing protein [Ditylenchus destructor]|nr:peroxin-3 domain-containing protein [Ditylenchus destructor]